MDDLIYRNALIEELKKIRFPCMLPSGAEYLEGVQTAVTRISGVINDAPAVDRWIPVEDALPENRCGVIFTVDRGHPSVCVGYRINSEREGLKLQRWFDKLSGLNFSDYDVKAWMPMPDAYEPPKEADNG